MSNAIAGHGALLAIEKDGDPAGTFTNIAELVSDVEFSWERPFAEATPHNDTIDTHVSGVIRRPSIPFTVNFIHNGGTHDISTGLQKRLLDGDTFGLRLRGPGSSGPTDEVIMSGEVMSFRQTNPVREGVRTAEFEFQPSGVMTIDGTTVGSVA